jgi:methionine transaminase
MTVLPKHTATGTTIFTVMTALAQQYGAINLSQGFPDFNIDEALADLLHQGALSGFNQYAPMAGLPALRQAIAGDFKKRYALSVDDELEVTVTPGATYAIYVALTAILNPGDEVILLEPAYDSYIPNIEMNGGIPVTVPLKAPTFDVEWNRVAEAISHKTKAIIVNTPHNPGGAVWSREDWNNLWSLIQDKDIFVIADEVYEQIVFDGKTHISALAHDGLRQRTFAIYSFGKVFNNTGWKTGYCIAPPSLTGSFRNIHQFVAFTANTTIQYALAHYIAHNDARPVGQVMEAKRDYFLDLLKDTAFTIHQPTSGSYFQIAGYDEISDLPDMEFAKWLTMEHGVATIPLSPFYQSRKDDRLIRFCFAKKEETLKEAVERLRGL